MIGNTLKGQKSAATGTQRGPQSVGSGLFLDVGCEYKIFTLKIITLLFYFKILKMFTKLNIKK